MIREDTFQNACAEVYTILKYLEPQDVKFIPKEFINLIQTNMNKEYQFVYNPYIEFESQEILRKTKVLLGYIFLNFWATVDQKEIIENKLKKDLIKAEEEKKQRYNNENLFKIVREKRAKKIEEDKQEKSLAIIKTTIFNKIWQLVKNTFKNINKKTKYCCKRKDRK